MNNLIQAPEHLPAGEVSHPPLTCNPVFHCGLCVVVANAVVSPPYFCPGGDKFSPGKHRLLLPGRGMQKGSLQRQTYLPLAWLQRDTAAVWPLMTGRRTRLTHRPTNSAATNLFVPAQCVHTSRRPIVLCESLNGQQKAKMQLLSSPNSKYVLTVGVGATCAASCNETANCWLLIYMCVCVRNFISSRSGCDEDVIKFSCDITKQFLPVLRCDDRLQPWACCQNVPQLRVTCFFQLSFICST